MPPWLMVTSPSSSDHVALRFLLDAEDVEDLADPAGEVGGLGVAGLGEEGASSGKQLQPLHE